MMIKLTYIMYKRGDGEMHNFVICEDESEQAESLRKLVSEIKPDCSIQSFSSGEALLESLPKIEENTIFLMDIVLNEMSGIDIAKKINDNVTNSVVIFISGYIDKATEVYDAVHCYFIYKPELEKRLPLAIHRAEKIINENKKKIVLSLKDKHLVLNVSEICFLERVKRKTFINTNKQKYECAYDLEYFMKNLNSMFVRCHRSFIVNLNEVKEYRRTEFILNDHSLIPISRSHSSHVNTRFQDYLINRVKNYEINQ